MTARDSQRLRRRCAGARVYICAILGVCGLLLTPLATISERDVARPESAPDIEAVTPAPSIAGAAASLIPRLGVRARSGSTSTRLCVEPPESTTAAGNRHAGALAPGVGARPVASAITPERSSRGPPEVA
jgi:hypothetical protein